jgi:hypothetical protein
VGGAPNWEDFNHGGFCPRAPPSLARPGHRRAALRVAGDDDRQRGPTAHRADAGLPRGRAIGIGADTGTDTAPDDTEL